MLHIHRTAKPTGVQCFLILITLFVMVAGPCGVLAAVEPTEPAPAQQVSTQAVSDAELADRIRAIFREIPSLSSVEVQVESGVVRLSGQITEQGAGQRAAELAGRVEGVVTVENHIERDVSLDSQLTPALETSRKVVHDAIALLPLLSLAIALFFLIVWIGGWLARRQAFWERVMPNPFIAELASTTVRVIFVMLGLVLALNLVGATALLGAVLGSAGVIGLAVGFAVRDTIENYIASMMLSLRQPFRPKDHVVINGQEGRVIRLTSRATILMTLDGNHLRIPNAEVFKARILNYTRNPERRFEFELGVDAEDDPLAAIQTGIEAMQALEFVLQEPPPQAVIKDVGDSNIVICYMGWMNQHQADFGKSRSLALAKVKQSLEDAGFGLPEPIYRLRFDSAAPIMPAADSGQVKAQPPRPRTSQIADADLDVAPEHHIDEKVEAERRDTRERDLLSGAAPEE